MAESNTLNVTEIPPTDSTPTLIASASRRKGNFKSFFKNYLKFKKVFGLNSGIPSNDYCHTFYYNILPFKVKEIVSAGGEGEYICYWTVDDRLLFSGFLSERNYLFKYNLQKKEKIINNKMTKLYEFKWKDFIKNKLLNDYENFNYHNYSKMKRVILDYNDLKIKRVCALDKDYIIIELENNILFYYCLKLNSFDLIPIQNIKWIKGGVMSSKVYIYTKFNKLFTFCEGKLEKEKLNFLQKQHQSIRLAATTNCKIDMLVTEEDNKIYIKPEELANYGFGIVTDSNKPNEFEYRNSPFENSSKIIGIKGGFCHFIILLENKKVYSIGFNSIGQLGINESVNNKTIDFRKLF